MSNRLNRVDSNVFLSAPQRIPTAFDDSWAVKRAPKSCDREWSLTETEISSANDPVTGNLLSWPQMPIELFDFLRNVFASRELLEFKEDWDGEGGKPIQEPVWNRMSSFLTSHALRLWKDHRKEMLIPAIQPGSNGGIDIHWETAEVELFLKIPADPSKPAEFYGDNFGNDSIEGTMDLSHKQHWLPLWLMGQK